MAYTLDDLSKLESAIAEGVQSVRYSDKEVTYRSLHEMKAIRDEMRTELGLLSSRDKRRYAEFSKGL